MCLPSHIAYDRISHNDDCHEHKDMVTNMLNERLDDTKNNALIAMIDMICNDAQAQLYRDNSIPYALVLSASRDGRFHEYEYEDLAGYDFANMPDTVSLVVSDCTYTESYPCEVAMKYAKTIQSQKESSPSLARNPHVVYLCLDRAALDPDALDDMPMVYISSDMQASIEREYSDTDTDASFLLPASAMSITRNGAVSWHLEKAEGIEQYSLAVIRWNYMCSLLARVHDELSTIGINLPLGKSNDSVYDDYVFCHKLLSLMTYNNIDIPYIEYDEIAEADQNLRFIMLNEASQWKTTSVHYPLSDTASALTSSLNMDWDVVHSVFELWEHFIKQANKDSSTRFSFSTSKMNVYDTFSNLGTTYDLDIQIGAFFDGVPVSDIKA